MCLLYYFSGKPPKMKCALTRPIYAYMYILSNSLLLVMLAGWNVLVLREVNWFLGYFINNIKKKSRFLIIIRYKWVNNFTQYTCATNVQAHAGMQRGLSLFFNQLIMVLKSKSSSISSHKLVSIVWSTSMLKVESVLRSSHLEKMVPATSHGPQKISRWLPGSYAKYLTGGSTEEKGLNRE